MTYPKHIYSISIGAIRHGLHETTSGYVFSEFLDDAQVRASNLSLAEWPLSDGWKDHHNSVTLIPDEMVISIAKQLS